MVEVLGEGRNGKTYNRQDRISKWYRIRMRSFQANYDQINRSSCLETPLFYQDSNVELGIFFQQPGCKPCILTYISDIRDYLH